MESLSEALGNLLTDTTDELYVQNPCKVVGVHGNYVDVLLYINDEEPDFVIYNVPVMRPETQRAYIFLGIKEGDRGVCRFFDRSTEGYLQSDFDYNSDERQHDINDRCFELGFLPDAEAYEYLTTADIEIGLKSGTCKISINDDGTLNIVSNTAMNVTAPTVTINGNVVVNGTIEATGEITGNSIPLSTHIHGNGNNGADTTAPKV